MARKVIYWVTTVIVAALSACAAFSYLSANPQAVQGFAHVGYPQQLRILLGIAKLLGAIVLVVPAIPKSGPTPDSRLRGSRRTSRIIWPKMAQRNTCH